MLKLKEITKTYVSGEETVEALKGISIEFRESELVSILGQSGCGKTTLLNIIGGLDRYTTGDLIINGKSTKEYKDRDWDTYRNHSVGFVFQSYNLIPHQSVLSNVELALTLSGCSREEKKKRAIEALKSVGLGNQIHKKPNQLSGGQMQRVAIARAIVNNPDIILADEPTGALDTKTSVQIMDILKEIAKDRLVVMVTHNPELAREYSTRIVELRDGEIISDSKPVTANEIENEPKKIKRTKLKFTTALGLSLNNLMTKKGRTILTAFAGAIGIIGIALILALSNGVNDYVASIESETMGSYPIELEKETMNLSGMLANGGPNNSNGEEHGNEDIYSDNVVKDSLESSANTTVENDLGKFKEYLEENIDSMSNSIAAVEYGYDISPIALRKYNEDIVTVSPSYLSDLTSDNNNNSMGGFGNNSTSSVWTQMVSDQTLREGQYELLAGEYPDEANEIALIISADNEVSDYTLYTLGLMDYNQLTEMVKKIENDGDYEDSRQIFKYTDVLGMEYQVFAPCQLYKKVDDVWLDKSEDEDYLAEILGEGLTVKITAVLRATEDADISSGVAYTGKLTEYLINTTLESDVVNEQLNNPDINILTGEEFEKDDEEEDDDSNTTASVSKSSKVIQTASVTSQSNETQVMSLTNQKSAYSVQLLSDVSVNTNDTNNIANSDNIINTDNAINTINTDNITNTEYYTVTFFDEDGKTILAKTRVEPRTKVTYGGEPLTKDATETTQYVFVGWKIKTDNSNATDEVIYTDETLPVVTQNVEYIAVFEEQEIPKTEYKISFLNYDGTVIYEGNFEANEDINSLTFEEPTKPSTIPTMTNIFIGWKSSEGKYYETSELPSVTQNETYTAVFYEYEISTDSTGTTTPTIPDSGNTGNMGDINMGDSSGNMGDISMGDSSGNTGDINMGDFSGSTGDMNMDNFTGSSGSINMDNISGNMSNIDTSALQGFSGGDSSQLSSDQLAVMMAQMDNSTPSTYEEVLEALGYCTVEQPSSISLYPTDFEGKKSIEGFIEEYNNQVENEYDKVTYTDMIGTLTSSITSIVNMISYVLIAFVAISLVVSSIMIAIITYISVLERTKEIGVLRALGASKKDVSKIFNAETFIEGFISGLIGVGVTLLLCIPVNSIVFSLTGVNNIAALPMEYSVFLIGISIILTVIAGIIPSRAAAKKDPVIALRSE